MLVVFDAPVPVVTLAVPVVLGGTGVCFAVVKGLPVGLLPVRGPGLKPGFVEGVCFAVVKGLPVGLLPVNGPGLKGFVPVPVVTLLAADPVVGFGKLNVRLDPTPVPDLTFAGPL